MRAREVGTLERSVAVFVRTPFRGDVGGRRCYLALVSDVLWKAGDRQTSDVPAVFDRRATGGCIGRLRAVSGQHEARSHDDLAAVYRTGAADAGAEPVRRASRVRRHLKLYGG